jgi:para-nitrobenzyl esterase
VNRLRPHSMGRRFVAATACLLVAGISCRGRTPGPPDAAPPTVMLATGTLEGIGFGSAPNEVAFLGVPYAAPPVGNLRWKPPQPVRKWDGTRDAAHFGAPCPQLPANWLPYIGWNEDCLYLNVWTTRLSTSARLPVIVYFHGGSNTAGYGQMTPLGPVLSEMGVVVVSANYRLGPMGFLALPALSAESEHRSSGNYGLLDQIQALRWVRENISHLGGDPGRIIVMGQSAGAVDICLLMTSPLATGLFQGAILESGDCQGTFNEDIRTAVQYNEISGTGEAVGQRLADDLGVGNDSNTLRKLRNVPPKEILKAWSQDPQVHFDAIVDGWAVPDQPAKIFAERREMHIPVLVGSNADEATVFGHGGPRTVAEYRKYLVADTGHRADQEFEAYPAASDADVPARYMQLQDDSFAYGAYSMAQAVTHADQKAYLYCFTYAETGKRAPLGAYHGEELMFLSDSFPSDWQHSQDDNALGQAMRTYWAQFARTGDPNSPGLPRWPTYEVRTDRCLELGRTIRVQAIASRVQILDHIMNQIFAEFGKWFPG